MPPTTETESETESETENDRRLEAWDAQSSPEILEGARRTGREQGLAYAGALEPEAAWLLFHRGDAVIVDVRTAEEWKFVGHVPGSHHAAWQTGTALIRNPRFLKELEQKAPKSAVILLLCRSGKRSAEAAAAATKAGFQHAFNVREGFEGDINADRQRGEAGGWRLRDLPWIQD